MLTSDTEAVVHAYIDACNGDRLEDVLALIHPDVELREAAALPGAVTAIGFEQVSRYLERFATHWVSFEWDPLELRPLVEGKVLMRARLKLEGRRSGIPVDREWVYVFEAKDGKLFRQWGFDDVGSALATFPEDMA